MASNGNQKTYRSKPYLSKTYHSKPYLSKTLVAFKASSPSLADLPSSNKSKVNLKPMGITLLYPSLILLLGNSNNNSLNPKVKVNLSSRVKVNHSSRVKYNLNSKAKVNHSILGTRCLLSHHNNSNNSSKRDSTKVLPTRTSYLRTNTKAQDRSKAKAHKINTTRCTKDSSMPTYNLKDKVNSQCSQASLFSLGSNSDKVPIRSTTTPPPVSRVCHRYPKTQRKVRMTRNKLLRPSRRGSQYQFRAKDKDRDSKDNLQFPPKQTTRTSEGLRTLKDTHSTKAAMLRALWAVSRTPCTTTTCKVGIYHDNNEV